MTIIDNLSLKKIYEKLDQKAYKKINTALKILGFSFVFLNYIRFNYLHQNEADFERPYKIVDKVLKTDNLEARKIILDELKKDPSIIDHYPNNEWEAFERLDKLVFEDNEKNKTKLENKIKDFKIESETRIILDGNVYFSQNHLDPNSKYIESLDLIYDPDSLTLYNLNPEKQNLETLIRNVKDVLELEDATYFIQDDNSLIKRTKLGKFEKVYECEKKCDLKKIVGTPYAILFENNQIREIIGDKNLNEELYVKLDGLAKNFRNTLNNEDKIKVVYMDNALFINSSIKIFISSNFNTLKKEVLEIPSFNSIDYLVSDFNADNIPDLAVFECGFLSNYVHIYHTNSKGESNIVNRFYSENTCENSFNNTREITWTNPSEFKERVKKKLKQN